MLRVCVSLLTLLCCFVSWSCGEAPTGDTVKQARVRADHDRRIRWWSDARFGLMLHWGLYSIPAGQWNGVDYSAEWIRDLAHISRDQYRTLASQFNPLLFDATEWVRITKDAGMKYIVITAKHHDGFCLFNSDETDFDVMATPGKRDILMELADACRKENVRICWYYSIMDWDHPDYLPAREWETNRSPTNADFNRYVRYLKNQLRELLTRYGDISVLWFDGEWEAYWTKRQADEVYSMIRELQPDILINDRLPGGRSGMGGFMPDDPVRGDFGVTERTIPAEVTGEGVHWEACQTLNESFAYSAYDIAWKSPRQVMRSLAETISKGGNFLLALGPRPDGTFPQPAVDCLSAIGSWMRVNGEAVYGTKASPVSRQGWGFCTRREIGSVTRVYLHVMDWPADGTLALQGMRTTPQNAFLLNDPAQGSLRFRRKEDAVVFDVPSTAPDPLNSVVVVDFPAMPESYAPADIRGEQPVFVGSMIVEISTPYRDTEIWYTTDGSEPTMRSSRYTQPFLIFETCTVSARRFRDGDAVSPVSTEVFTKVGCLPSVAAGSVTPGVTYRYYLGAWRTLPEFSQLTAVRTGITDVIGLVSPVAADSFAFVFEGFLRAPARGLYSFFLSSDDGSRLVIDDSVIIDNDGAHMLKVLPGYVGLEAGLHSLRLEYFESRGDQKLELTWRGPGFGTRTIQASALFHKE